jgi:alpha-ketoglutarate-dependent taurine dioxygenase
MQEDWRVEGLDASFGAVVRGVDLRDLESAAFDALYELWLCHALLIFPDQHLSTREQVAFARRFGDLEFELAAISNVRSDGRLREEDDANDEVLQIIKGNMGWHADSTYMPVQAKGAVFSAHEAPPEGGATGWADMRAAYSALDESTRIRIQGLSAHHSLYHSQAKIGHAHTHVRAHASDRTPAPGRDDYNGYGFNEQDPPLRPLVKIHPETGRPSLLIGRHAFGIPGLKEAESESLLDELVEFACRPPRVYHHAWTPGDTVLWDNRCLLHRAMPWDMTQRRVMYHSRIAGSQESEFAAPG